MPFASKYTCAVGTCLAYAPTDPVLNFDPMDATYVHLDKEAVIIVITCLFQQLWVILVTVKFAAIA